MSFNWLDFLTLSEKLQSDPEIFGLREASLRSAISRAYYAAFQYAMNLAKLEGYLPKHTGDDHIAVQKFFRDYTPKNYSRRKIAVELDRLRDQRRLADYEENLHRDANIPAQIAISLAKNVIANVDSLQHN
jgi:uncharacterized protein (UPF0332 family)